MSTTILLIDDDDGVRKVISRYLQLNGFSVLDFSNSKAAFESCNLEDINLVVCDLRMPGLSGLETIKIILNHAAIPCILISAYSEDHADSEEFSQLRKENPGIPIRFLHKPFLMKDLLTQMTSMLQ